MPVRRIRVVTLIDRFGPIGGAEQVAALIAGGLDPSRFDSTLCSTRWHPEQVDGRRHGVAAAMRETAADLEARGVRVVGLGRRGKLDLKPWTRLARDLRGRGVDVLHAHQFGSNVWGTVIGRAVGTPVVIAHEHTWSYEGDPLRKLLDRELVGRGASAFVAVSHEDQRRMIEVEGVRPEVTRYLPNGVPRSAQGDGRAVREELGIGPDDLVVGSVGNLRAQKAFDVLIDAAALLRERHPRLTVLIAGGGPERAALAARIAERRVGDVVHLLGYRRDVPSVVRALDVAVSSSDYEGMPLSVLEYMEAELPVVATRVGGVPDLIEDGVHGLLVPPRDPASLAAAVGALLDDPARRAAMGERGRARRMTEFDVGTMIRRVEDLYVELVERSGRRVENGAGPPTSA